MNSALKPALPQGAGGQNNQSGTSPKTMMGGSQPNHSSHGHMGQMISQSSLHPQNMSNNVPHQNQMSHLSQSIQNVAQNMTMSAHNNQNLTQLGLSMTADYSVNQGTKNPNNSGALSLVQDKTPENYTNSNQPLALTRSPEKNENDNGSLPQSNGVSESPKTVESALPEESKVSSAIISGESQSPPSIVESQISAESSAESSSDSVIASIESKPDDLSTTSVALPQEKQSEVVLEPIKEPVEKPAISECEVECPEKNQIQDLVLPENEPEVVSRKTSPEKDIVSSEAKENTVLVPSDESVTVSDSQVSTEIEDPKIDTDITEPQISPDIEEKSQPVLESTDKENRSEEPVKEEINNEKIKVSPVNDASNDKSVDSISENGGVQRISEISKDAAVVNDDSNKEDDKPQAASPITPTPQRQVYSIKKADTKPKSTLKLATVPPNQARKRRSDAKSPTSPSEGSSPAKKPATPRQKTISDSAAPSTPAESRISKRNRTQVQPYQSPTPELAIATKLSATQGRSTPTKQNDEKLIVFYKNEYLAVRNAEGSFYVCQAVQNVYRNTRKIKIRWLSQNKELDPSGETFTPDFYDTTDMECVLTTLSLTRASGGNGAQKLSAQEEARAKSILDRAIEAEKSGVRPEATELSEEHPDGLDLSLYKDESQLDKKKEAREAKKRSHSKMTSDSDEAPDSDSGDKAESAVKPTPKKKPKRSPKKKRTPVAKVAKTPKASKGSSSASKASASSGKRAAKGNGRPAVSNNQTPAHPTPPSKTATATIVSPSAKTPKKSKATPGKTNAKSDTPKAKTPKSGKKSAASTPKSAPIQPIPSTSTGKATRTPRKPPSKK